MAHSEFPADSEFRADSEFVVEVDQTKVRSARRRMLRLFTVSAWVSLIGAVLIVGLAVPLLFLSSDYSSADYLALLLLLPALIFLYDGSRKLRDVRRTRRLLADQGVAPVAMRISATGLRCGVDAAPDSIILPWEAVAGFRLHTYLGREVLVLELAPGVGPETPGVAGLDHPDVRAVPRRKVHGAIGPRFAVGVLRKSVAEISHALFHYSGGRVWVR